MEKPFICDREFIGEVFANTPLPKGDYEDCIFRDCSFANGYLDNQNFMGCQFIESDLSNANIAHTTFNEVRFVKCKLVGLKFEECNDLLMRFTFEGCIMDLASFYGLGLKHQVFEECRMHKVDFTGTDLTAAAFPGCDLNDTVFDRTILEKADFQTARDFRIDPERNRMRQARFAKENLAGLLGKYDLQFL